MVIFYGARSCKTVILLPPQFQTCDYIWYVLFMWHITWLYSLVQKVVKLWYYCTHCFKPVILPVMCECVTYHMKRIHSYSRTLKEGYLCSWCFCTNILSELWLCAVEKWKTNARLKSHSFRTHIALVTRSYYTHTVIIPCKNSLFLCERGMSTIKHSTHSYHATTSSY